MKKSTKYFMLGCMVMFILVVVFTGCDHASNPNTPHYLSAPPTFLSGPSFSGVLKNNLGASSTATSFVHSVTPPPAGASTYLLSTDDSPTNFYAWLEGTTIKFYVQGFTDSNIKIPLPENSNWLFDECSSLQQIDLSFFDTSNVTSMRSMFVVCSSLTSLNLSGFDTSKVTTMNGMFERCSSLTSLNLSNFDTSKVTSMSSMFSECTSLTSLDLSNFDTSNVTDMSYLFSECSSLTSLNLSNFDTSKVTTMDGVFYRCSSLTSFDLSNFDTSNVTDMGCMFYECTSLTSLDLSSFDTSNVTDMSGMFNYCSVLETIYASNTFDVSSVTDSAWMFDTCWQLTGGAGTAYNDSYRDKTYARIDNPPDAPGYFTLEQ